MNTRHDKTRTGTRALLATLGGLIATVGFVQWCGSEPAKRFELDADVGSTTPGPRTEWSVIANDRVEDPSSTIVERPHSPTPPNDPAVAAPASRDTPHSVVVSSTAALSVTVLDESDVPLGDVEVRVWFRARDPIERPGVPGAESLDSSIVESDTAGRASAAQGVGSGNTQRSMKTDALGVCVFEDLPAEVRLHVDAYRAGRVTGSVKGFTKLRAGERTDVKLTAHVWRAITLRFLTESGEPVGNQPVGLRRASTSVAFEYTAPNDAFLFKGTTNDQGHVECGEVLTGAYYAGLRCETKTRGSDSAVNIGVRVDITPTTGDSVEVALPQPMFVTGIALDVFGRPLPTGFLRTNSKAARGGVLTPVGIDGTFRIGPLVPGECSLVLWNESSDLSSESATTTAGSQGLTLQLQPPRRISIRAVSGETATCRVVEITLDRDEAMEFVARFEKANSGAVSFPLQTVPPQAIRVVCADGRIGIVSTTAPAFDWRRTLDIALEPAGQVLVRNETTQATKIELRDGADRRWAGFVLDPSATRQVRVPGGEITLVVLDGEHAGRRSSARVVVDKLTRLSVP